jgi:hypothetical protein
MSAVNDADGNFAVGIIHYIRLQHFSPHPDGRADADSLHRCKQRITTVE